MTQCTTETKTPYGTHLSQRGPRMVPRFGRRIQRCEGVGSIQEATGDTQDVV